MGQKLVFSFRVGRMFVAGLSGETICGQLGTYHPARTPCLVTAEMTQLCSMSSLQQRATFSPGHRPGFRPCCSPRTGFPDSVGSGLGALRR